MKNLKKVLALVLAVVMIMGTVAVASAKDFKDVKATDNYAEAIDVLSNLGIIDGFTDGEYKPEGTFTRAQAAKMVAIVHNAATNGKIKGQDGISDLYGNAQNAFTDCTGNWAVAYINYCRATGLLDGITRTTYAPNSKLTGVQWLKLMLTTLNFDTNKEGYLGAGWDVNVLNRANEIGLLDGLADGWKGNVPVTRGEAAQILYNTLTKYLVEYGQLIKSYGDTSKGTQAKPINASFVSNEQVNKTGLTLAKKMGVGLTYAHDVFMRPGYVWSYGSWSAFYLKSAAKTYTGKVTACDILVDLGYAKTSKADVEYVFYRDGRLQSSPIGATISHKNNACEAQVLAGNSALTQVFKMVKNNGDTVYLITVVDTVLGKFTNVDTTKHGKVTGNSSDVDVYANVTTGSKFTNAIVKINVPTLTSYAKGDYVLFNAAKHTDTVLNKDGIDAIYAGIFEDYGYMYKADTKVWNNTNMDVYAAKTKEGNDTYYVVPLQKAETIASGKYTGRSLPDMDELTVNGEKYNTNCTYTLDEDNSLQKNVFKLEAKTLDFFVDQYGNLIGDVKPAAAAKAYGVLDGIYWTTAGATYSDSQYAVAGLVKSGEKSVLDITAAKYNGAALNGISQNLESSLFGHTNPADFAFGDPSQNTVSVIKANNGHYLDMWRNYGVVAWSVNADGTYNVAQVGTILNGTQLTKTNPNLGQGADNNYYYADEYTEFTVLTLDADGNKVYTPYTGIANVPTMQAVDHIVAVTETGKTYASYVFVDARSAIFAGSTTVAFVGDDYMANYQDTTTRYSYYNVYINGVKTTVEVDKVLAGGIDTNMFEAGVGLYKLEFNSDSKLIKATRITLATALEAEGWKQGKVTAESEIVATFGDKNYTINYTDGKLYIVTYTIQYNADVAQPNTWKLTGITEGTKDDLKADSKVLYHSVAGTYWMADTIYVFVEE